MTPIYIYICHVCAMQGRHAAPCRAAASAQSRLLGHSLPFRHMHSFPSLSQPSPVNASALAAPAAFARAHGTVLGVTRASWLARTLSSCDRIMSVA